MQRCNFAILRNITLACMINCLAVVGVTMIKDGETRFREPKTGVFRNSDSLVTKYKNKLGGNNFRLMAYFWVIALVLDPEG